METGLIVVMAMMLVVGALCLGAAAITLICLLIQFSIHVTRWLWEWCLDYLVRR